MDRETGLQIKRIFLKKSSGEKLNEDEKEFVIPPLSYSNLEILHDSGYVDDMMLEEIDNLNPNFGLTNELFFECISKSINYLAYEPFRVKIKEWQEILEKPRENEQERQLAENNLKRIGTALIEPFNNGKGRPEKGQKINIGLYFFYQELIKRMNSFEEDTKEMIPHKKKQEFIKRFPEYQEYADAAKKHRTAREIAKEIVCRIYDISERSFYDAIIMGDESAAMAIFRSRMLRKVDPEKVYTLEELRRLEVDLTTKFPKE